jgi:hypothetical protein
MPSNSFEDKLLLLELFVNIAKFSYVASHSQQGLQTHTSKSTHIWTTSSILVYTSMQCVGILFKQYILHQINIFHILVQSIIMHMTILPRNNSRDDWNCLKQWRTQKHKIWALNIKPALSLDKDRNQTCICNCVVGNAFSKWQISDCSDCAGCNLIRLHYHLQWS